jgi:hypothetical protein
MWGGHSCPPPLPLLLRLFFGSLGLLCSSFYFTWEPAMNVQVKSGGQECPPHITPSAFRVFPSIAFLATLGA